MPKPKTPKKSPRRRPAYASDAMWRHVMLELSTKLYQQVYEATLAEGRARIAEVLGAVQRRMVTR